MSHSARQDPYQLQGGIYVPEHPVTHRDEQYDPQGFSVLREMQERHFWYRGRHRFIVDGLRRHLTNTSTMRAIDLGGGCGGWLRYLKQEGITFKETALGDSSRSALELSASSLGNEVEYYQIDLLNLHWNERWETAFLLDVIEHIPEHECALEQVHRALTPGGFVFITVPALRVFWSYNDTLVGHQRRYSKASMRQVAERQGFKVVDLRYFMFALSPLLFATRTLDGLKARNASQDQRWKLMKKAHQIPTGPVNSLLGFALERESKLGHRVPLPWGTSLLAILQKA